MTLLEFTPNQLQKIAEDNLTIIDNGYYIFDGNKVDIESFLINSIEKGILYTPNVEKYESLDNISPNISISEETTTQAAYRMAKSHGDVVILNFASAKNPGGGWLHGAKAQEEDICRQSCLGYLLEMFPEFYSENKKVNALYTDYIIYNPDVVFFRDDNYKFLETPYTASVITSPAPNCNNLLLNNLKIVPDVLNTRAAAILNIAAKNKHKNIVLGAWGCGVFKNKPNQVANAFKLALKQFPHFENVCFAICENKPWKPSLTAFKEAFNL